MAVQPFTVVPRSLTAGDTLALLLAAAYFPADQGWALTIAAVLPNTDSVLTLGPSTNSSGLHAISVAAATTASWVPGTYHWQARVAKGAEVYTLALGDFDVVAALGPNQETRTFEAQMLAQVEAALLAMGSSNIIEYKIGDRQARRYTRMELLKERAWYRSVIRRQCGEPIFRLVPTEFKSGKTIVPEPGALDIPYA